MKSLNHLIYIRIENALHLRSVSTLVHLINHAFSISHESSSISCLQSIRRHRLVRSRKVRIRKVFSSIRLRNRSVLLLLCQKNRSFRHTKSQTSSTSRCSQDSHFCNQDSHSHDLRLRRSFDFRFQITFVAFVSIISTFAMICSFINALVIDISRIVDR